MAKKTRNALPPVSLGVFRQMVYDCGAEMMSAGFNKDEIICRLMTLADYPIKPPTVKVIIEDGVPADVLTNAPANRRHRQGLRGSRTASGLSGSAICRQEPEKL